MVRRRGREIDSRYAGWSGDGEYAVTTVSVAGEPAGHAHCRQPCPSCPWRTDSPLGAFPAEAYRHSARTAYDMAMTVFACHMAGKDKPLTCAGFLLRGADHNLQIRFAIIQRRYDPRRVSDGGIELFASYRAMAIANGVPPDDPVLAPCRSNEG